MCISVCLYMWAYTCIQDGTCWPLGLYVWPPRWHLQLYTDRGGEVLHRDLTCHKSQRDYGFRLHTNAHRCPRKTVAALSLALDGTLSCSALTAMAQDHGIWWQWELVAVLALTRKDFLLCPASLGTCQLVVQRSAFRPNGLVEMWLQDRGDCSVACTGAKDFTEALEGLAVLASAPSV